MQLKKIASPTQTIPTAYHDERLRSGAGASAAATLVICQYQKAPIAAMIRPKIAKMVGSRMGESIARLYVVFDGGWNAPRLYARAARKIT